MQSHSKKNDSDVVAVPNLENAFLKKQLFNNLRLIFEHKFCDLLFQLTKIYHRLLCRNHTQPLSKQKSHSVVKNYRAPLGKNAFFCCMCFCACLRLKKNIPQQKYLFSKRPPIKTMGFCLVSKTATVWKISTFRNLFLHMTSPTTLSRSSDAMNPLIIPSFDVFLLAVLEQLNKLMDKHNFGIKVF